MDVVLLASVGNRDLHLDGELIRAEEHRERGQEILRKFAAFESRLSAPQITACVNYVIERHGALDTVVLIVTDQPEEAPPGQRGKDTIYTGEVIGKLLQQRFAGKIDKVRLGQVRQNPALYDEMYDAIGHILRRRVEPEKIDRCYVMPVGGTPAITTALLLQSCQMLEDRCVPLYLREGAQRPEQLDFANQIKRSAMRRMALERLQARDFAGVEGILREAGEEHSAAMALAAYASRRLNFDFRAARDVLDEASQTLRGEARYLALRLNESLEAFLDERLNEKQRERALIAELFRNASITHRAGRYIDFLGRAIRFEEATLRLLVELGFGIGADEKRDKENFEQFIGMDENSDLANYLRSKNLDPKRMNVPVFLNMCRYLAEGRAQAATSAAELDKERWQRLVELVDRLDKLRKLRNESIIAHGYEGVSLEQLAEAYGGDVVSDMQKIAELVVGEKVPDTYEEIRRYIEKELAR